jgi:hypothetical protein
MHYEPGDPMAVKAGTSLGKSTSEGEVKLGLKVGRKEGAG